MHFTNISCPVFVFMGCTGMATQTFARLFVSTETPTHVKRPHVSVPDRFADEYGVNHATALLARFPTESTLAASPP